MQPPRPFLLLLPLVVLLASQAQVHANECASLFDLKVRCRGSDGTNGDDCNSVPPREKPDCEAKVKYTYSLRYTGETYGAKLLSVIRYRDGSYNGFGKERTYLEQLEGTDLVQGTEWEGYEEICEDTRADTTLEVRVKVHGGAECTVSDMYEHRGFYGGNQGGGGGGPEPTDQPVAQAVAAPEPTPMPQMPPTDEPTPAPQTDSPTDRPTDAPVVWITDAPVTPDPTPEPTSAPIVASTPGPTRFPTRSPTESPVESTVAEPQSAGDGTAPQATSGCSIALGISCTAAHADGTTYTCNEYATLTNEALGDNGNDGRPCPKLVKFRYTAQNVGVTSTTRAQGQDGDVAISVGSTRSSEGETSVLGDGEVTLTTLERTRTDSPALDFLTYYSANAMVLGHPDQGEDLATMTENVNIDFCSGGAGGEGGMKYETVFAAVATGTDGENCVEEVTHCLGVGCEDTVDIGDGDGDGGSDKKKKDKDKGGNKDDPTGAAALMDAEFSPASARRPAGFAGGVAAGGMIASLFGLFLVV